MPDEVFHMVDIEKALTEDRTGEYRDRLCRELAEERAGIKRQTDAGLPPEQYERAARLLAAYDSADHVVRTLWATAHR